MKPIIRPFAAGMVFSLALGAGKAAAANFHLLSSRVGEATEAVLPAASGITGVPRNMPVVGRLIGADSILFRTAMDIQNNTDRPATVGFWIHGMDLKTGATLSISGSVTNDETDEHMLPMSNLHSDDIVGDLIAEGMLPQSLLTDGFLGSAFLVFDQFGTGEGSVQARFYSEAPASSGSMAGGTIGVSLNSNDIGRNEPARLFGVFRDCRGMADTPQHYSNMFLNNVGYVDSSGALLADTIDVNLTAYSTTTGERSGSVVQVRIAPFQTVGIPSVLTFMGVSPENDDTIIVVAEVVSGQSRIQGVGAHIDEVTKDPSGFEMHEVRPMQTTAPSFAGTWNMTFTILQGSQNLGIPVGTHIPGRMTVVASGPNASATIYGVIPGPDNGVYGAQLNGDTTAQTFDFEINQTTACAGPLTGTGTASISANGNTITGSYSGHDACNHTVVSSFTGGRVF
ncbi:MAG TPA: hypothetical protein VG777_04710 [Thermoanaerobaculia bacterium]|nr:hypothetical protein [Thermoanaerobaculia bacterium]